MEPDVTNGAATAARATPAVDAASESSEPANALLVQAIDQLMRIEQASVDGWSNDTTGLGTSELDKTINAHFRRMVYNDEYYNALFEGDALAARACEEVPKEIFRAGYQVVAKDAEATTALRHEADGLEVNAAFRE